MYAKTFSFFLQCLSSIIWKQLVKLKKVHLLFFNWRTIFGRKVVNTSHHHKTNTHSLFHSDLKYTSTFQYSSKSSIQTLEFMYMKVKVGYKQFIFFSNALNITIIIFLNAIRNPFSILIWENLKFIIVKIIIIIVIIINNNTLTYST